jgi:adenylate cyclase
MDEQANLPVSNEQAIANENWRAFLMGEAPGFHRTQRVFRALPSNPRCKVCYSPFGGFGGQIMKVVGRRPSRMNPHLCGVCEDFARTQPGGAEIPLTLLFADIRGSTALAESLGTQQFAALISRFYNTITEVLINANALIDRLIGDEVVALFVPVLNGQKHAEAAVQAARAILEATGHNRPTGPWVPVGVGVHTGSAFVGAIGKAGISDITALGDDVNLTARLASIASTGEIILTEATRAAAHLDSTTLEPRTLDLKGRSTAVDAWLTRVGAPIAGTK